MTGTAPSNGLVYNTPNTQETGNQALNANNGTSSYDIAKAPLYFVRSGYFNLTNKAGVLRYASERGLYWSSRTDTLDQDRTYYLYFNITSDTSVYPSRGPDSQYIGQPLRCLSADLEG